MRTFERTHPWIRFGLDLSRAGGPFWMLLGEACSKCEHLAGVPLRPAVARRLHALFLAKGVLGTTAIEGNTLTEDEVVRHIEGRLDLPRSKQYLGQEIDNIVHACNEILQEVQGRRPYELTRERICAFNGQVLDKLKLQEGVVPGTIRSHEIGVSRYRGAPAADCAYLVDRLCTWLREPFAPAGWPGAEIADAVLKAVAAHLYVAWIHPFGDGNGRTARLVEFAILVSAGVPSPAAHLMSNHYNQTRTEYYRQLDAASRSGGEVVPFLSYALQGFVDGLRDQLGLVRKQQLDVAWENYVHEVLGGDPGRQKERRRHLVLDLSRKDTPVSLDELPNLTARVARAYARLSHRTLLRDIAAVERQGLVRNEGHGYVACREVIRSFLPWSGLPSTVPESRNSALPPHE